MTYFIVLSLILNAVLLMAVTGPIYFLLYVSTLFNIAAVWYIYRLIRRHNEITEEVDNISDSVQGLGDHLESIHELEMFYGEPVIQALIEHIIAVQNEIQSYSFNSDMDYDEEEEEDGEKIEE